MMPCGRPNADSILQLAFSCPLGRLSACPLAALS